MTFDTNVSKVRLRLLLTKVKQNCIVILPYFGLNYNFLWYCFFRQIYIIITYYVIFFVLRFFSWQKGVQSTLDCTPFLRFQHLKIPYYFYYFFWKSRATVAHFFGTVISLFFPLHRRFSVGWSTLEDPRPPVLIMKTFCIHFHFRRCSALNAKKDVVIWERVLRLFLRSL